MQDSYRTNLIKWFNSNAFNGIQINSIKDFILELIENESEVSVIKYILSMSFDGYCFEYEQDIKNYGLSSVKDIDAYITGYRIRNKV